MERELQIKYYNNCIIIEKNGLKFSVEKKSDGDIWFNSNSNITFPIDFYSRNQIEWRSYNIFANLMKTIVGRYILSDDYKKKYNTLPKDFIDLETRKIIWHSDSNQYSSLYLHLKENQIIVSIKKDQNKKNTFSDGNLKVRIRTSGSDYGYYYQEFENFFNDLSNFAYQLNSSKNEKISKQRKLSLFNKNN